MSSVSKIITILLILILSTPVFAAPPFKLKDEGTNLGVISELDCAGSAVACTRSGKTGTITVSSTGGASISDAAFDSSWDGDTTDAPSKNTVYDYLSSLSGGGTISDVAYDATTWNAVTNVAPSKNAVRDQFESLYLTTTPYSGSNSGSIKLGLDALVLDSAPTTSANIAIGNKALKAVTTGTKNICIGNNTCTAIVDSTWNVAIGDGTLTGSLTTASVKNTFIGSNSGQVLTSGSLNTSVGYHSMVDVTTGGSNTSVGVDSMHSVTTGGSNTSMGYFCMEPNVTGSSNACFGSNAMRAMTSGSQNIAIGSYAGGSSTSGDSNIWIGYQAGYGNVVLDRTNQILIGQGLTANISNLAVFGNSSITNVGFMGDTSATYTLTLPGTSSKTFGMRRNTNSATAGQSLGIYAGGAVPVGLITAVSITSGGSGYAVGDLLTITAGNSDATIAVTAVSGGVITSIQRVSLGTGYSTGSGQSTSGGSGIGATVNITGVTTATDKDGGPLKLGPGVSTGMGNSYVSIQGYTKATSTGSADNTLVDRLVVTGAKNLTDAATSLFEIALPTLKMTGGRISWTIEASDGTDMQALAGITTFSAVNKGGVYTTAITNNTSNDAKSVSSGTLTCTWSVLTGTNKITIQVTPSGSLTETTYRVTYTVENNSPQAVTIL